MPLTELVRGRYLRQQLVAGLTARRAVEVWRRLDPADLDGSWPAVNAAVVRTLVLGQLAATQGAQSYVSGALREQGGDPDPAGRVAPAALAGASSAGTPLDTRLSLVTVKQNIAAGVALSPALEAGAARLRRFAVTETQDAGRSAVDVAMAADRTAVGWVRYLSPPSCPDCTILAGRFYRHNTGFARHKSCDCIHVPSTRSGPPDPALGDPARYVREAPDADLAAHGWLDEDVAAIRAGADPSKVVNAKRGMRVSGDREFTTEAATGLRPTPRQIAREAGEDRDEQIRLLTRHGYIT